MNTESISTNFLISEYIKLLREQQHYQANVIMSYNNAFHNINNNISSILLRNSIHETRRDSLNTQQPRNTFSQNSNLFPENNNLFSSNNVSNTLPT